MTDGFEGRFLTLSFTLFMFFYNETRACWLPSWMCVCCENPGHLTLGQCTVWESRVVVWLWCWQIFFQELSRLDICIGIHQGQCLQVGCSAGWLWFGELPWLDLWIGCAAMARSGVWRRCRCVRLQGTHSTDPRHTLYHQDEACRLMWCNTWSGQRLEREFL